jgi:hypothetical protein
MLVVTEQSALGGVRLEAVRQLVWAARASDRWRLLAGSANSAPIPLRVRFCREEVRAWRWTTHGEVG